MAEKARLVIEIDTERAKRVTDDLRKGLVQVTASGESAAESSKEFGKQVSVTNNIVHNYNTTVNNSNSVVNKSVEATKQITQQTQKFGQEIKSTNQQLENQKGSLVSYNDSIKALAKYMVGLVTINEAVSRADGFTQNAARIRNATDSAEEYKLVQDRLFQSTKSTYRALGEAQEVYLGLSGGMKALGYTTKDTLDVADSLSFSFVANAARADQAQSAIDALNKSMAKGSIDTNAWISIVSAADNIIADMAKTTGKSEVEIRQLGATGKISLEDLIRTLKLTKDSNKELADAMENSLADGLTTLSNAVTKYVGELNMAMGLTNNAAGILGVFADNIDIVMNAAMAGGLAYLTKSIITNKIAVEGGILSTISSHKASLLKARSEVAEATATLNSAKAHLANVRATNAEAQAKYGATAAAARYAQAQAAVTVATNAQTEAQKKLSLATMSFGRLASGAFALVGGPIGAITLGVAGLTAVYSHFSKKAEEANQKLAEQAKIVEKADEELKKLTGNDKKKAADDLTEAFEDQNKTLRKSELAVGSALVSIENYARGNAEVEKISREARTGVITYTEAIERLNNIKLPTDIYDNLKKQAEKYDENAVKAINSRDKLAVLGKEVVLVGHEAQNAAVRQKQFNDELQGTKDSADAAAQSLKKLREDSTKSMLEDDFWIKTYQRNVKALGEAGARAFADFALGWRKANNIPLTANVVQSKEQKEFMDKVWLSQQRRLEIQQRSAETERNQTKEQERQLKLAEKQAVLLAGNDEKARNMLRVYQAFRNAGLGDKQARVMTAQVGRENDFRKDAMFGSHKDANNGYTNTGFISWQKSRSTELMKFLQGQGALDKNGKIQQNQDSLDAMAKFLMQEISTNKSYSRSKNALLDENLSYRELEKIIGKNFIGWDYEGKKLGKGKASQHLSKQDNYYDQISKILGKNPDNVIGAVKNLSKFEDDAFKARAKTLEEIKQLQETYDSDAVLRNKKREEEISQATILGQTQLIPKITERFNAQEKLAQKQFDFETNGYKWTEEKKLEYTYETNGLKLVAEGKLTEEQRKIAIDSFKLQQQQELGVIKLAQEQRLFQAELFMMSEIERTKKRYALEYDEIAKIMDLEERRRRMSAFQADFIRGGVGRITDDQYETSGQFLKSRNYDKPQQTAMQSLDEDYAQTYQKLQENLAAVLESEKASHEERLDAERVFKEARQQMEDEYYLKAADARKSDYENQLMQLGSLTSQLDSYWSNMTGIVRNAAGEQSGLYKGMYIAQQAFAISSATISALQAYNQILASPWYLDVISKSTAANLVLGMGMANVGMIAGQTIAGFANGGYTGKGGKYEPAGIVHKGEVVWSQADIKKWGGVEKVEQMRKAKNPDSFISSNTQNTTTFENVMNKVVQSSRAFNQNQAISNIFNLPAKDDQIIYKSNQTADTPKISTGSDLYHDGKVYFSPNGLVQDRSNLEDVHDFTLGRSARPQAEALASVQPSAPTINFKIEVVNQVKGATVEAEQLDENTVRLIIKDELDKKLPREVPKIVSDQIKEPNSSISRAISTNTTARRNR